MQNEAESIMSTVQKSAVIVALTSLLGLCGVISFLFLQKRKKNENDTKPLPAKLHALQKRHEVYNGCIYMDYNATTPIFGEVVDAMRPYFEEYFGNPSSSHIFGPVCKKAVYEARMLLATLLNCASPDEIIFTSCGSESDNRAIDIAIQSYFQSQNVSLRTCKTEDLPQIITSSVEHPAVLAYLRLLAKDEVITLIILSVSSEGFVHLPDIDKHLNKKTALVSIMHSNNEVGTIQPIRAIAHVISAYNKQHKTNILFHADAAQSIGKLPVDVSFLGVDMLTIVGHKFGAPKGIAALYLRNNCLSSSSAASMTPLLIGGGQEKGRRAGTENVPYIVALGTAAEYANNHLTEQLLTYLALKLHLLQQLHVRLESVKALHLVKFNGPRRAIHPQQLQEDMKVLKLLFQSNIRSAANTATTTISTPTASAVELNSPTSLNKTKLVSQQNSASDVLEQLPNTISVSFSGLIGHEIVAALSSKVSLLLLCCCCLLFSCLSCILLRRKLINLSIL